MIRTTTAICALLLMPQVWAQAQPTAEATAQDIRMVDTGLMLRAGAMYTDNLGRNAENEEDLSALAGVDLNVARVLSRVEFFATGNLDYLMYESSNYDDELIGALDANFTGRIIPEVFNWVVNESFGQVRTDIQRAAGPGNREHFNRFSTGPDLFFPVGSRTHIKLSGRYADRRFEFNDDLNSQETSATAGLVRQLAPTQEVGVFGSARRVEYDNEQRFEYEVYSAYVNYSRTLARGAVSIDIGGNQLDLGNETESGMLLRLNWDRALTERSRLSVHVGREFQDSGDVYSGRNLREFPNDVTGEFALAPDPMTRDSFEVSLGRTGARLDLRGRVSWGEQNYETDSTLDRERWTVSTGLGWRLTETMSADVGADFRREKFEFSALENEDLRAYVSLARQLSRRFGLVARYEYFERNGQQTVDFEENQISVFLTYTPLAR